MNLVGHKYGRLTVISEAERKSNRRWLCVCDCGNTSVVSHSNLRSGHTSSCGCLAKELLSSKRTSHGCSRSRMYTCWLNMKSRCNNSNDNRYSIYGGRGIKYDPSWESFQKFKEDMQDSYSEDLTLDRIDPNKGYCKENCRWVSYYTQSRNKRGMSNNTSGCTGVYLKVYRGYEYWTAYWNDKDGVKRSKSFSILKFGDSAKSMAEAYRLAMITEEGYSEYHGNIV